jgi:hypothetical protein
MPRKPNPGHLPADCIILDEDGNVTGYRYVHCTLFNGIDTREKSPGGWPAAGGRPPTVWKISKPPHPFQIESYEVI